MARKFIATLLVALLISSAGITVDAGIVTLSAGTTAADADGGSPAANWLDDVGLLWADGVEPVDSELMTTYAFDPGDDGQTWYVDFDAPDNGAGVCTEADPCWSLDEVNAGLGANDDIYLTGTATPAKIATQGDMALTVTSEARLGTTSNPTVIRSWPGQSRVKFDGEYTNQLGIYIDPSTNGGDRGVVVINVEVTRSTEVGIVLGTGTHGAGVSYQRVISVWAHDNLAATGEGTSSAYGGVYVVARGKQADIEVRNSLIHGNQYGSDGSTKVASDNIGGINVLSDPSLDAGTSTVKVYLNEVYDEWHCVNHKHDNNVSFEGYWNYCHDSAHMFHIRVSPLVNLHHNLFHDDTSTFGSFIRVDGQNQYGIRTLNAYNNTLVNVDRFIGPLDSGFSYADITNIYNNVFYRPGSTAIAFLLGDGTDDNFNVAGTDIDNNCFYLGATSTYWTNNNTISNPSTKAQFETQFGTDNNLTDDPDFVDAANDDYMLDSDSPCRDVNGEHAGAFDEAA